jgi:hypothetical protein
MAEIEQPKEPQSRSKSTEQLVGWLSSVAQVETLAMYEEVVEPRMDWTVDSVVEET